MRNILFALFTTTVWWSFLFRIIFYFLLAYLIHRLRYRIVGRLLRIGRFTGRGRRMRTERLDTIEGLFASILTFVVFTIALLFSLSLFVATDTLVWMVGLFSAAFGLGARPLISDFLTGISFLLEDHFDVGDKVEIMGIEGVVEQVNLRTMSMRAPTGELYVVPNGEVRVVRNFSRGRFSTANVSLKFAASDLARAIPLLEALGEEAIHLLPNLLEPWQVISESGEMGQQTELTLVTKTRFGKAAEARTRLLALVQERLDKAGISLAG